MPRRRDLRRLEHAERNLNPERWRCPNRCVERDTLDDADWLGLGVDAPEHSVRRRRRLERHRRRGMHDFRDKLADGLGVPFAEHYPLVELR